MLNVKFSVIASAVALSFAALTLTGSASAMEFGGIPSDRFEPHGISGAEQEILDQEPTLAAVSGGPVILNSEAVCELAMKSLKKRTLSKAERRGWNAIMFENCGGQ